MIKVSIILEVPAHHGFRYISIEEIDTTIKAIREIMKTYHRPDVKINLEYKDESDFAMAFVFSRIWMSPFVPVSMRTKHVYPVC